MGEVERGQRATLRATLRFGPVWLGIERTTRYNNGFHHLENFWSGKTWSVHFWSVYFGSVYDSGKAICAWEILCMADGNTTVGPGRSGCGGARGVRTSTN